MKVFSENIHLFCKKCETHLKLILTDEVGAKVARSRFIYNYLSLPLRVVLFESNSTLGYFDPHTYQIALNKKLMFGMKEKTLKDILRHELAHYINFIENQVTVMAHGPEFKAICTRFGWDKSISKASLDIDLSESKLEGDLNAEKLKTKFKALLKLSESDNPHEAELATIKANQLLLKYNLNTIENIDENIIYSNVLMTVKKKSAKLTAIYDILQTFMVKPVLVYGHKQVALEANGPKENVELAEYVANFLDLEFENLWKKNDLKGLKAKNSFFSGLAKGYLSKSDEMRSNQDASMKNALIKIEKNLNANMNLIYNRMSHTSSKSSIDAGAFDRGKKAGKSLTINQAVKNKSGKPKLLTGVW